MIDFDTAFEALTGYLPLRWQRRLFERLCSGQQIPRVCDLPTGLGKTSVIPIFIIALARQSQDGRVWLPRRLVYVVNRRTVVDQATSTVQGIRERLYDSLETGKLRLDDLAPRIQQLRRRQEQLQATRLELEQHLSDKRVELADMKTVARYVEDLHSLLRV